MNGAVELVVPVAAAMITGGCAAYVGLQKQLAAGARKYAIVMLAQAFWSLAYVAELLAPDLPRKVFWDDVQLPPPYLIAFALLFSVYEYIGRSTRVIRRWLWAFAALPVASCVWVFSDRLHGFARATAHIADDPPFGALLYDFSTIELLSFAEVYAVSCYAVYLLFSHAAMQTETHRRQASLVGGGILLSLFASVPGLLGYRWFGQRDSSPLWFAIGGLCVTWALSRYRLFDLVPIARDAVIENLTDAIFVLDSQNRLLDANPTARALLGSTIVFDVRHAEPLPDWLVGRSDHPTERLPHREVSVPGHKAVYELSEAQLSGDDGKPRGRALILHDVTERRRAQAILEQQQSFLEQRVGERTRELERANASLRNRVEETRAARAAAQASEARFRAIFDGAYELIGMLAPDGRLLEANRAALLFAGVGAESLRDMLFWETAFWAHSPDQQQRLRADIERAAGGEFVRAEVTHYAANGELRVLDFSLTPVLGEDGVVLALVAEGRDITDRKRGEEENARLQAQLYQAQKLDSIGRLAGGVAHDFNNLLTVILGNLDLARMTEAISPRMREHLHDIEEASQSAAALTRQLLAFARRQIAEPRVLDLNDSVSNVNKLLSRLLGEDVRVKLELEPELWHVRVDPSHAEQMLINLAVNARDAMPKGGQLVLRTENCRTRPPDHLGLPPGTECVVLSVSDEGVGIGADILSQIFEPFFTTKPLGMGTGLGLAMVYGAMQQAFGGVDVHSAIGRGSTFRLYFPRCGEAVHNNTAEGTDSRPPRGSETVALVEDQELVRSTTKRQLERLGYRVMAFASAAEALPTLLSEQKLSLLITDVVLPGVSGRQLAEEMSRTRPRLAVLFISGYTEDVVLRHGIEVGQVQFLAKPFNVAELATAVRRALETNAERAPSSYAPLGPVSS